MKAIRTRYYGPTNTRGSHITARDGDGNRISISYPHQLNSDVAHELAAYRLMEKMRWPNALNGGGFENDMYWTMLPREDRAAYRAYRADRAAGSVAYGAAYSAARSAADRNAPPAYEVFFQTVEKLAS